MKSVIVMGNARSGTSMTAGLLSILGVQMGELPVEKMKDNHVLQNPKGAFENPDFIKLTSEMHRDWSNGMGLLNVKNKYDTRIQEVIAKHQKTLWGFKSAAAPPFLSLFLKYMGNPHIVIVLRNVYHNALSWQVHMRDVFGENVDMNRAMKVISDAQHELLKTSIGHPSPNMFITYEDIKKDSWAETQRLAKFLNLEFEGKEGEVKEFIMPSHSTLNAS